MPSCIIGFGAVLPALAWRLPPILAQPPASTYFQALPWKSTFEVPAQVVPGPAADRYCGAMRPGHFRGVLSIVLRLFMWTRCRCAAFGAKDAQQLWLIRRMVKDFNLEVELMEGPTLREADGLAMSSRNVYLDVEERREALTLHQALEVGKAAVAAGLPLKEALCAMSKHLAVHPKLQLEYLHITDWESLDSLVGVGGGGRRMGGGITTTTTTPPPLP